VLVTVEVRGWIADAAGHRGDAGGVEGDFPIVLAGREAIDRAHAADAGRHRSGGEIAVRQRDVDEV